MWRMNLRFVVAICLIGAAAAQTPADNAKPAIPASASSTASTAGDPLLDAHALMGKRQFAEAATAFKTFLEKNPSSPEAHAGLVLSLLRGHQFDDAEEAAKRAVAAAPSSAMVHAAAGDVTFRMGRFADTEAEYRSALKLDANSARAQFGIGRMFQMVSMNKKAKEAFSRAHELGPEDKQIYGYWLQTLSYSEQLDEVKKAAGEHPTQREQAQIDYLTAVVKKKPWMLTSEIKLAEIKIFKYGRSFAPVFTGNSEGVRPIGKGYGVDLKFNNGVKGEVLLDTGAGGLLLGKKLAEKIGVVKIADSSFGGIGDKGPVQGYIGWVDKIAIGPVEFQNCLVEVSSRGDILDGSGLMGADVFQKFLITFDFRNEKLLLAPLPQDPTGKDDDAAHDRYIAPEMQSFSKVWRFGHDLVMPVLVSDKAMGNFIIDTGASFNSVSPKIAGQITKTSYQGMGVRGLSGNVKEVLNGDKAILQFAKVRVRSDDIPVFDMTNTSNSEGTEIAGFMGIKTLVQMKMTIDYRDGLVNFEVYDFKPAHE
jgi:Flp pilus assembly protein TadD